MRKKTIFSIVLIAMLGSAVFGFAQADGGSVTIPDPLKGTTFNQLLLNIGKAVSEVVASLGAIMIIVAGILFLTSAGNPNKMETAKKALFYAIVGLAIGLSARGIIEMVQSAIGV